MSTLAIVLPKAEYDRRNEAEFRDQVTRTLTQGYDRRSDLTVPFGKTLGFTSAQGQVITFGYNESGQFTIKQDANSPFGLASISYVSSVQTSLEGQIAVLEVDVEAANDAAEAAASSAMSAQTSATNAGNSATAAQTSATNASTSASNAATSATNASNSASNASTSASQASTSASNAAGSASAANISATAAAASEFAAAGSATAASGSASNASSSATQAATSASNAAGSASNASTSATNAANSATSAGNSATAASTSASQASTSATNAGASEAAASTSANNAANSATSAGNSATAASGSASNAATSATNAGNSATSAQNSATSAATEASNAATSAGQASTSAGNASTSASQASTSASNAAGSASSASTSATNAANSATSAGNSATAASTSASNASTSATNAGVSASAAQTSATNAAGSASNAASSASTATTQASNASASAASAAASSTLSATFASGSQGSINSSATFADNANATGVPTNWVDWANGSGTRVTGIAPQPYAWTLNGVAGSNTGIRQVLEGRIPVGWYVIEADAELISGTFVGAGVFLYSVSAGGDQNLVVSFSADLDTSGAAPGNGVTGRIYRFRKLVQFTQSQPSSGWPAFYAASHWDGLGSVASANSIKFHRAAIRPASQAEIEARQAKLDLVTTNANVSTNATAIATESAARASADSVLTAQVRGAASGGPSINTSPNFADNANATGIPTNWADWSWGWADATRVTGIAPQPYAWRIVATAGRDTGIYQNLLGRVTTGWHVIEADITLNSGVLSSAGIHVNWDGGSSNIVFSTDPDINGAVIGAGTTGKLYKFRKLVQVTAGTTYQNIYAMSIWGGYGSLSNANDITWHRVALRAASQAEIEARQAKLDLVTANAAISANQTAIANETSARAAADTTLSAQINVNSNRFPHPQPLSTDSPSTYGWQGDGITVGQWEPLGGLFYYKARGSGGAAATDFYYYDVDSTASAWVSTGEQYTLSAVGYGGAGTSGDRLTMWMEFFNSSNTLVYSSPTVTLGSYAPTNRYSSTSAYTSGGEYVRRRVVFKREWAASGGYQDVVFNRIKLERGPVATAYTNEGAANTLQASVTTNASAIATVDGKLTASYGVTVDANGRIASMKLLSNGTTSSVKFTADTFQIFNGSTDVAPFEVTGGNVKIKSANVGTLNIGSGGITIQSGSSGARIVISNSLVEVYDSTRLRVRMGIW